MVLIFLIVSALCFGVIFAVAPIRRCALRFINRSNITQEEYAKHPEFYAAQRSYGAWYRLSKGKRIDGWQVLPEQIESKRVLKQLLPRRTPEGQSAWWTMLFYTLGFVGICSLLLAITEL